MLDALMTGTLVGAPQEKTGPSGRPFVQCRVRVPSTDVEAIFALVTAFDSDVRRVLSALQAGDPVSLAGTIKLGVWSPTDGAARPSISMVASAIISPYSVRKKRQAVHGIRQTTAPLRPEPQCTAEIADDDLSDAF